MDLYSQTFFGGKKFALLIDPDQYSVHSLIATVYAANESEVNIILVGGSIVADRVDETIEIIKKHTDIPVILFPGSLMQLSNKADGVLLLSLISGRNPEYLIGNHVLAAPYLKKTKLEIIPTGYILIESKEISSVEYVSNTRPIPRNKIDIIVATAVAGEMLGNKLIYLEAGSGASEPVDEKIINEVKRNISIPLIVGGGLKNQDDTEKILNAGADIVVVGNAIEKDLNKLHQIIRAMNL